MDTLAERYVDVYERAVRSWSIRRGSGAGAVDAAVGASRLGRLMRSHDGTAWGWPAGRLATPWPSQNDNPDRGSRPERCRRTGDRVAAAVAGSRRSRNRNRSPPEQGAQAGQSGQPQPATATEGGGSALIGRGRR